MYWFMCFKFIYFDIFRVHPHEKTVGILLGNQEFFMIVFLVNDDSWSAVVDSAALIYDHVNDFCWFEANLSKESSDDDDEKNVKSEHEHVLPQARVLMFAVLHSVLDSKDVLNQWAIKDSNVTTADARVQERARSIHEGIDAPVYHDANRRESVPKGGHVELCRATMDQSGALSVVPSAFATNIPPGPRRLSNFASNVSVVLGHVNVCY